MKSVPDIRVVIMRDPTEKISNTFPAYEVPILVHVHGGRVDVIGPECDKHGEPLVRDMDEAAEINRLLERHGEETFTRVYGPAGPGCLERVIDGVLEMADSDEDVMTEAEEHAANERAKARQRRLSQMAARRKNVQRPRLSEQTAAPTDIDAGDEFDGSDLADALSGALSADDDGDESDVDGPSDEEAEAARKRSEAAKKAAATRARKQQDANG